MHVHSSNTGTFCCALVLHLHQSILSHTKTHRESTCSSAARSVKVRVTSSMLVKRTPLPNAVIMSHTPSTSPISRTTYISTSSTDSKNLSPYSVLPISAFRAATNILESTRLSAMHHAGCSSPVPKPDVG